jgi:hypothetical protein
MTLPAANESPEVQFTFDILTYLWKGVNTKAKFLHNVHIVSLRWKEQAAYVSHLEGNSYRPV